MATDRNAALEPVTDDLRRIFADRLEAVVAYGWRRRGPVPSLVLVRTLGIDDLNACAGRVGAWERAGAATPLILTRAEFARSLDAFPIEYGEIIASHTLIVGRDPFEGLSIRAEDLRRACEVQVKSHLLHLREDYMEAGARPRETDALVRESAAGFAALLRHLARLDAAPIAAPSDLVHFAARRVGLDQHVVDSLVSLAEGDGPTAVDGARMFPDYLANLERLSDFVDHWRDA